MSKEQKIAIVSAIIIAGVSVSVGYHYVQGYYLERAYPYNTFLFLPSASGTDFKDVVVEGASLDPYRQYGSAQYPLLVIVGYGFSLIASRRYTIYLLLVGGLFFGFGAAHLRVGSWWKSATHVFVIAGLSYPFLFAVDRGNFELLVAVCLLAFLYFFAKRRYLLSAVLLSFAIALKLTPVIFLVLFLPERKYREISVSLAGAAAITLASLLCFKGGLAANASFLLHGANVAGSNWHFEQFTSLSSNIVQRGVSILTLVKIIAHETGWLLGLDDFRFLGYYLVSAALAGGLLMLFVIFVEKALWRRTAIVTFALLLLPHISADYKLLHVFLPLYLFLNAEDHSKLDPVYLGLFGLLLIPKDYLYFTHVVSDALLAQDVSISVPLNILIMIAMTGLIVATGFAARRRATGSGALGAGTSPSRAVPPQPELPDHQASGEDGSPRLPRKPYVDNSRGQ